MIKAAVIGASGYIGMELVRLLLMHPDAELVAVTSRRFKGLRVGDVLPHLQGFTDLKFEDVDAAELSKRADIVFTAVPHGAAMSYVPKILENASVVDLSADYRLNPQEYEKIYKKKHEDPRIAVYGLTELHTAEIKDARLVANPGCYPTGAVLAVAPLVAEGIVAHAVFDAKSGISGGGAEPSERSHFPNLAENIIPYNVTKHRHVAEIKMELARLASASSSASATLKVSFTPHVIPCIRGILTTAHVLLRDGVSVPTPEQLNSLYERFYEGKPFIRIFGERMPSLSYVRGTNFCDIGFWVDEDAMRIVVVSAIDNLVKGGAGQAVQNMNLMFGLVETTGLHTPSLTP
ncbi:MAG: N-acetyl-gamma-glutamylphosphate reductase [Candidatus Alkanophagales archaeon MCA70_species_2]|nr:N-acetyl-gamma-glutamylphosphate reductase [Candidatus Alkanophaga liquidiphilum]RLG36847.1 MAG: N-acetyl-gamma-glutamyl-phosphate reductase [Candidatus Alkanophagales archaeon]